MLVRLRLNLAVDYFIIVNEDVSPHQLECTPFQSPRWFSYSKTTARYSIIYIVLRSQKLWYGNGFHSQIKPRSNLIV